MCFHDESNSSASTQSLVATLPGLRHLFDKVVDLRNTSTWSPLRHFHLCLTTVPKSLSSAPKARYGHSHRDGNVDVKCALGVDKTTGHSEAITLQRQIDESNMAHARPFNLVFLGKGPGRDVNSARPRRLRTTACL